MPFWTTSRGPHPAAGFLWNRLPRSVRRIDRQLGLAVGRALGVVVHLRCSSWPIATPIPMKSAESMVKMYACTKATKSSSR